MGEGHSHPREQRVTTARQATLLNTHTDVTWNPKQMVGKTLNTEVQEEGLQTDQDGSLLQKIQLKTIST